MALELPLYNAPMPLGTGTESSGANSCTPGLPPGTAAGDLLFMLVNVGSTGVATVTPGGDETWETCPGMPLTMAGTAAGTNPHKMYVFVCRATAGIATPTVTRSVAGDYIVAQITSLRGAYSWGNAVDAINAYNTDVATGTNTVNTLTFLDAVSTVPNTAYLMFATDGLDSASAAHGAITNSSVSFLAEKIDGGTATGGGGITYCAVGAKYYVGAFVAGAPTCTPAVGAKQYARYAIAVKPPQIDLQPDRIESAEVVYAPALSLDFNTVRPPRIESAEVVYGCDLVLDLHTIRPPRIESSEAVYGFDASLGDTNEPTITVLEPAPEDGVRKNSTIKLQIDDDNGIGALVIIADLYEDLDDPSSRIAEDVVFDGESFGLHYQGTANVATGALDDPQYLLDVRRDGGWIGSPKFRYIVRDTSGNVGVAA